MRAVIVGASGNMGREMLSLSGREDFFVCGGFDERTPIGSAERLVADVIVEFAKAEATEKTLDYAVRRSLPVVIGTTGHTDAQREKIVAASREIAVFYASNFSVGMAATVAAAKRLSEFMPSAEITIVETHRKGKTDCPGGSAKNLRAELGNKAEIFSVRRGDVKGVHEVIFTLPDQTVTLTHEALSRNIFALGAVESREVYRATKAGIVRHGGIDR